MTCIVGLVHEGKVYIGGDSAGVDQCLGLTRRADKKVFRNGDFLFGFTSSFRMGQLLQHAFVPPKPYSGQDVYAFMVTAFVDAVRQCLKNGGYASRRDEVEEGGNFLVGYSGRVFSIEGDYQVGEPMCGYAACGCGESIALGSLFTSAGQQPVDRVNLALAAAEHFSAGVCGPFNVESV